MTEGSPISSHGNESTPATSSPALDQDVVRLLMGVPDETSREFMRGLFELFTHRLTSQLADLHAAFEKRDRPVIAELTHYFKGSARSVGAFSLARLFEQQERRQREGDLEGSQELLEPIRHEFQRVRDELAQLAES